MDDAFFREQYERDGANKAKQSYKDYAEWVRVFYEGKRFPPVAGWNDRQKEILAKLPAASHAQARASLERVGRVLAAEWAKDNAVRKVSTSDLQTWGKRFSDAAKDAAGLEAALHAVEAEIAARAGK